MKLYALKDTWKDILPFSNNFSWSQDAENLAMELNFDSVIDFPTETFLSFVKNGKEFFKGIIIKKVTNLNTYSYTAMDYMWYLNKSEELIQLNNICASDAIHQLASIEEITCNIEYMQTKINKIYKGQSISNIIDDILEQVKNETGITYIKFMLGNIFTITKNDNRKIRAKLLIEESMSLETSIEDKKNSIIIVSNENENLNIFAKATDKNNIKKIGKLQQVINVDAKNLGQANQIANNILFEKNKSKNSLSLSCINIENGEYIKPNCYLYFYLPLKFGGYGWYWIKSVSHNLSNNIHKINLTLEW